VRTTSVDLPGGSLEPVNGQMLLRTNGQAYREQEFEDITLRSSTDGALLKLGDVATVVDGFEDTDQQSRFDNERTVLVQIFRVGNESALAIAETVRNYVAKKNAEMPQGISLTTWQDDSRVLLARLNLLLNNGIVGFMLVFIALALFLKLKLAIWVVIGMLISFFGAFWMMPYFDVTINLLSLFAFILVLGIVVDDAIVVGENIYTHIENDGGGVNSAIRGAQRVGVPVVFAVLTTVAAFTPLLTIPGNTGKFLKVIPIIAISTLLFSLIESLFVLPTHLSHVKNTSQIANRNGLQGWWSRIQDRFSSALKRFANNQYRKTLAVALSHRTNVVAGALGLLIVTISLVGMGWVKFTFMPDVEADNVVAFIEMPQGTSVEATAAVVKRLENAANQVQKEFEEESGAVVEHMLSTIGDQPFISNAAGPGGGKSFNGGSHLAEVNLQLLPAEDRSATSPQIARRWRELTGTIPGIESLSFNSSLFGIGAAINFELAGNDYQQLTAAADALKLKLADYPGTFDITDSFQDGKREMKLSLKPEAETLGLTLADLARQVRQAFYGEEAQRIIRGRDEVKVMIRYPESARRSRGDLENMRIRTPGGLEVPFGVVAAVEEGRGFSTINRANRKRTVNVTSDVDMSIGNSSEIVGAIKADVLPALIRTYPGINFSLEGEQAEQAETIGGIQRGFVFALLIIYVLLAIPFRSYVQPLIVMSAIPFGLIGAIGGHLLLGMNLTILSFFGIVALTGVVVNDSLVMVDFINRARERGHDAIVDAVKEAGVARFRPILLTSVTTFAGLTPLLLERSLQAQFLIPMAISLAFGVLFATSITLILVPTLYMILEDLREFFARKKASAQEAII